MTERTESVVLTQEQLAALRETSQWQGASVQVRDFLEQDAVACLSDGVEWDVYLADVTGFASGEEYYADCQDEGGDGEPQGGETAEAAAPAPAQAAPAPTHTMAEYKARLDRWGKLCESQAEANYAMAAVALDTVQVYLGTFPGKAQRSSAVAELARVACDSDPDYHYPPQGVKHERHQAQCVDYHRKRVLGLIQAGATLRLTFGATAEAPVVGTDGQCRKAGAKGKVMPWRRVRELLPLVQRVGGQAEEHTEQWRLLPYVADEAVQALVGEMVGGLKAEDVVKRVRQLCLASAEQRLAAGDKAAADDVAYWGGKLEQGGKAEATADKPEPAAADKPAKAATAGAADDEPASDEPAKAGKSPTHREGGATNLLQTAAEVAKTATVKDFAGMAWAFIQEHADPEAALEEMLLVAKGDVSKAMCSGIDALLLVLRRARERAASPAAAAPVVNGQHATAGAA